MDGQLKKRLSMSKKYTRRKHTPWYAQTRSKRNRSYIIIKKRCDEASKIGRLFSTDLVLNEKDLNGMTPEEAWPNGDRRTWWIDIFFMSKKHRHFYNVELITKNMAAIDAVDRFVWHGDTDDIDPSIVSKYYNNRKSDSMKERLDYIADKCSVTVKDKTSLHFNYVGGVGLHAVVDADDLTEEVINKWIENFWENGEISSPGTPITLSPENIRSYFKYVNG